ncbi:ring finger domain [Pyrenophora seminiperda CCB06]|uniref:RING-type E3 ubiquitin transferase n=1 Tax=Pyrenophora seminiperda CCB06 TaxID=1302712 RepID=A0A3M7M712_9PLEO|nr:ring finger domain [Pyrenophora seminiperda CCB06]
MAWIRAMSSSAEPMPRPCLPALPSPSPTLGRHHERMPTTTTTTTAGSTQNESEDTCVICLSALTERAITVPCNHYTFDFVCLVSWLQEQSTCPLCKAQVTAVQYDWRSPTDYKHYTISRSHTSSNAPHSSRTDRPASFFAPYGLPRRPRRPRRPYSPPLEDVALRRRRDVYQRRLYSLHVGSNPFSGYRDISPQLIAESPDMQSKARTWIRRELRVFTFLLNDPAAAAATSSNTEFLLSYIISILKMVDLKASNGHAENLLTEFLGRDNSKLFLHELNAWLRSPYTKQEEWDQETQYEVPVGCQQSVRQ